MRRRLLFVLLGARAAFGATFARDGYQKLTNIAVLAAGIAFLTAVRNRD